MSPTSMKITLKQLEHGSKLTLDKCLQMEYRLVHHYIEDSDFTEGDLLHFIVICIRYNDNRLRSSCATHR